MARKKKAAPTTGEIKVVRRNKETGEIAPSVRGRPSPEWERGYVDADGNFHAGSAPKKRGRKPGRPKGSSNKIKGKAKKAGKVAAKGGALSAQLQKIIEREVALRLSGLHKEIASSVRTQVLADLAG